MSTPPGWYPDPGHTGDEPALERWWDGSTWTDYTRDPQALALRPSPESWYSAQSGQPQQPGQQDGFAPPPPAGSGQLPGFGPPGFPAAPGGSRRARTALVLVLAAVLAAALVGGIVLLNGGDGESGEAAPQPTLSAGAGGNGGGGGDDDGSGGAGPLPPEAGDTAPDPVNGISLPVPDGWEKGGSSAGGTGLTTGPYPCPGEPDSDCVRGGVFSMSASGFDAETAEGVAKEDISENAEDSYGKDPRTGKQMYGGISSHEQIKSEAVTVAGEKGYLVRWKVETEEGSGGYVQSLVFPSPTVKDTLVLVRFGLDTGGEAPKLSEMDRITAGIRPMEADGGSGDGEAI